MNTKQAEKVIELNSDKFIISMSCLKNPLFFTGDIYSRCLLEHPYIKTLHLKSHCNRYRWNIDLQPSEEEIRDSYIQILKV
jgi:hypothetical protein